MKTEKILIRFNETMTPWRMRNAAAQLARVSGVSNLRRCNADKSHMASLWHYADIAPDKIAPVLRKLNECGTVDVAYRLYQSFTVVASGKDLDDRYASIIDSLKQISGVQIVKGLSHMEANDDIEERTFNLYALQNTGMDELKTGLDRLPDMRPLFWEPGELVHL